MSIRFAWNVTGIAERGQTAKRQVVEAPSSKTQSTIRFCRLRPDYKTWLAFTIEMFFRSTNEIKLMKILFSCALCTFQDMADPSSGFRSSQTEHRVFVKKKKKLVFGCCYRSEYEKVGTGKPRGVARVRRKMRDRRET